jgi:hypothetical protein
MQFARLPRGVEETMVDGVEPLGGDHARPILVQNGPGKRSTWEKAVDFAGKVQNALHCVGIEELEEYVGPADRLRLIRIKGQEDLIGEYALDGGRVTIRLNSDCRFAENFGTYEVRQGGPGQPDEILANGRPIATIIHRTMTFTDTAELNAIRERHQAAAKENQRRKGELRAWFKRQFKK